MARKRYVCIECYGAGEIEFVCEACEEWTHSETNECPKKDEMGPGPFNKPCPLCVDLGWQPFVELER